MEGIFLKLLVVFIEAKSFFMSWSMLRAFDLCLLSYFIRIERIFLRFDPNFRFFFSDPSNMVTGYSSSLKLLLILLKKVAWSDRDEWWEVSVIAKLGTLCLVIIWVLFPFITNIIKLTPFYNKIIWVNIVFSAKSAHVNRLLLLT